MNRFKIIIASGTFAFAIVAAFATNSIKGNSLELGYAQTPNQCQITNVPQECGESFSNICTVSGITYYENQDAENPTTCVDFLTKP